MDYLSLLSFYFAIDCEKKFSIDFIKLYFTFQIVLLACLAAASATGYAGVYPGGYWPGAHGWSPYWAGQNWAGHGWAGHGWAGHGWAGHGLAGHGWAGHGLAGHGYAGHGPVVLPSGYLADTPAVAAAKGAHLTAVAHTAHRDYAHGYAHGYNYAPAVHGYAHGHGYHVPTVLPSGYLADAPDVAAVKAAHLTALAHQGGATHTYGHAYPYGYAHGWGHH